MTRAFTILAALIAVGFTAINGAKSQTGPGWIQLFDGKTLNGWTPMNDDVEWRVEDGALVADKKKGKGNPSLVSKNSYKDFEIYAEFWVSDDANSGIYIRCTDPNNINSKIGLRGQHLRHAPRSEVWHRRDRRRGGREPDAEGRRQVEYVRDHGQEAR